jgi:hypothetical protein
MSDRTHRSKRDGYSIISSARAHYRPGAAATVHRPAPIIVDDAAPLLFSPHAHPGRYDFHLPKRERGEKRFLCARLAHTIH